VDERKRTKAEEQHYAALMQKIEEIKIEREKHILGMELRNFKLKQEVIPAAWHRIERDVPVRPKKVRVTAALDADLVKWFRAMGHNYQARINAVLKAYMHATESREILSRKNTDWKGEEI
jgi:uncharacterized protein (DUF4415 family)